MTKICINCGHKKGSHKVYGGYVRDNYDGFYTQCQECECIDFHDINDYDRHRKWLLDNKMYLILRKLDDNFKKHSPKTNKTHKCEEAKK